MRLLKRLPCNLRYPFSILLWSYLPLPLPLKFCLQVEKLLSELGASKTPEGKWILPDGTEMLTKPIMREIMSHLHKGSHWGPQAM
jgi:hypothetical protein